MKIAEKILRAGFGWNDREIDRDETWGQAMLGAALFCFCLVALFVALAVL